MRSQNGWQWVGWALVRATSSLPYVLLLSRDIKRDWRRLQRDRDLDRLSSGWSTTTGTWRPSSTPTGFGFSLLDIALPIALGGMFVMLFALQLKGRPLLPLQDPALAKALTSPCPLEAGARAGG